MYKLESYSNGGALVVNSDDSEEIYRSTFNAQSEQEAEQIVIGLNRPVLLASLAALRFKIEVGGLEMDNGLRILTDRESQAQLSSAFVTLQSSLVPDTDWKAANGWEVVTLEQIKPIARAMAAHVRGCFRGERAVSTAITSATTMEQIGAIDIPVQFTAAYEAAFAEVMTPEQTTE